MVNYSQFLAMGLPAAVRAGRGRAEGKDVSGRLYRFPGLLRSVPGGKEHISQCCRAPPR